MHLSLGARTFIAPLLAACTTGGVASAQFILDDGGIPSGPANLVDTENIDFGDVDLDGDPDAALAVGGDSGNAQNRLWINAGGLQAGEPGAFLDETAARLPQANDDTRDVEFVDIDADGDLDLYVTNSSDLSLQGDRWLVNLGGVQGEVLGYFVDETASRWVGLGGPGSSIAPALLTAGTFVDWSADSDFGDLDNDGDLDLVHSSHGIAFGGAVPTRIFLNDGAGRFAEFNPSGYQLSSALIHDGQPALWAEGAQANGTTSVDGLFADIAGTPLDIDLGDLDGDFDLDLVHGSRTGQPRVFRNRLEESGQLALRDVTHAVLPAGAASADFNYEQELGDLDADGDLDLYGLNWNGFADRTFANDGSGVMVVLEDAVPDSGADDQEIDFLDFDADGDLDVYVASFSGVDRIYANDGTGRLTLAQTVAKGGAHQPSLDFDAVDLDGDGDTDGIVALAGAHDRILRNVTDVADTTPPYLPRIEVVAHRVPTPGAAPLRAQVYDNAPLYVSSHNPTHLAVTVDGYALPSRPMRSSAGQVFRGLIPTNLVGAVSYRVESADEYGNTGLSVEHAYDAASGLAFASTFGYGSAGQSGVPTLEALSVPFADSSLFLASGSLTPGAGYLLHLTNARLPQPVLLPGIAEVNVTGEVQGVYTGTVGQSGQIVVEIPIDATLPAGAAFYAQLFATDGAKPNWFSSSPGLEVVAQGPGTP